MENEFWNLVASGLWNNLLADLISITNKDSRRLMIDNGAFTGKLWKSAFDTLAYVPSQASIQRCWDYIDDRYYNPQFVGSVPPFVTGSAVTGGDTLVGDALTGYTIQVYAWDFVEFTLLGDLAGNSAPGAGNYVLAYREDNDGAVGLPSSFLTIS